MDIPVLAQNLTAFLAPFLPYLVKAGVEARPAAQEAVEDVAADPQAEGAKIALKRQRLVNVGALRCHPPRLLSVIAR